MSAFGQLEALESRVLLSTTSLQAVKLVLQPVVLGTSSATESQIIAEFTGAESETGSLPIASVRWGDGKTDRADPTSFDPQNRLIVAPTHEYHRAGVFNIAVTLVQNKKTVGKSVSKLQVLSISPGGAHLSAMPGEQFSGPVGQFTANYPVIESNTVINWGDRSTSQLDSIDRAGGGQYEVSGSHTCKRPGTYRIVVSSKVGAPPAFNTDVASVIKVKK